MSFAAVPFLRLGLIAAAIGLLSIVAFHGQAEPFWRPVSIGAVALLALRPESNVVGIPLSFLVGLLLTATFLVRPTGDISYPSRRSAYNDVRRLVDELRAVRMGRDLLCENAFSPVIFRSRKATKLRSPSQRSSMRQRRRPRLNNVTLPWGGPEPVGRCSVRSWPPL